MGNKLLTNRKQLILLTLRVIKRSRLHFLLFMQILRALLYHVKCNKDETMSHVYETQKHKIDSYGNKVVCG